MKYIIRILLLTLLSCQAAKQPKGHEANCSDTPLLNKESFYNRAVRDAATVDSGDICNELIAIRKDTPNLVWNSDSSKILMTMWKSNESYEQFYKNDSLTSPSEAYVTWVTTVPQIQNVGKEFIKNHPDATEERVTQKIKEFLGLMPQWNYDVFIEIWVNPKDLFRPCVDPEIDDSGCNIAFGKELPTVKNIKDYKAFYQNLYFQDFRTKPGIPWTGLGYTYNWGNPDNPIGASEFILIPNAPFTIKRVVPTMEYFKE